MGKPVMGSQGIVFFGKSVGNSDNPATLEEALASAAAKAVKAKVVTARRSVWFDVVQLEVEIGNQHVKTYKVGITQGGGG